MPGRSYFAGVGQAMHGGIYSPSGLPSWVTSMAANTWTPLGGTSWFSQATALLGNETQWPGTAAVKSILDAFGDPILDGEEIIGSGGGHNDGFCNALPALNLRTLNMSLRITATPGTCYPAGFPNATWPSGQGVSWLRTAAQHAVADQAFAAPFSAPRMTHRYGGQVVVNAAGTTRKVVWFYATMNEFNLETNQWTDAHERAGDYIMQRVAARADVQFPGLGFNVGPTVQLQQGTMAVYDELYNKAYVTLIPGDAGGGWRDFFFCWDPANDTVPAVFRPAVPCRESMVFVKAGRYIFGIISPYSVANPNRVMSDGFRFHIDSQTFQYFRVVGNVASYTVSASSEWLQEGMPYLYDAARGKLVGWSHNQGDRANIYELTLNTFGTQGGSGTIGDPFLWNQSKTAMAGTPPSQVSYKYNGFFYLPQWGVYVTLPHSTLPAYAIKRV